MKWIRNTYGPGLALDSLEAGLVPGIPKATNVHTVEELEALLIIGVYERDPNRGSQVLAVYGIVVLLMVCAGIAVLLIRARLGY